MSIVQSVHFPHFATTNNQLANWPVLFWGAWVLYTKLGHIPCVYAGLRWVEGSLRRCTYQKMSTRAPTQFFLTAHGEASGFQPTQSCLRQKVNKCIREERALPRLHCKTHMISLRNISCSSLLSRFHDLPKKKRCSIGSYIPTAAACSVSSLCICIAAPFAAHSADFAKILAQLGNGGFHSHGGIRRKKWRFTEKIPNHLHDLGVALFEETPNRQQKER